MPEKKADEITLKHPYEAEGKTIATVSWRNLTAKDIITSEREMRARGVVSPGDAERTFYMVVMATGLTPEELEPMAIDDYLGLASKAGDFL